MQSFDSFFELFLFCVTVYFIKAFPQNAATPIFYSIIDRRIPEYTIYLILNRRLTSSRFKKYLFFHRSLKVKLFVLYMGSAEAESVELMPINEENRMGKQGATSYIIGNIVGSGIFITPSSVLRNSSSVRSNLLCLFAFILIFIGSLLT